MRKTRILKLDFDNKFDRKELKRRLKHLEYWWLIKVKNVEIRKSTNGGKHVIIKINKALHPLEAVFAQIYLGSDIYRELMNWQKVKSGIKDWNILFVKKF